MVEVHVPKGLEVRVLSDAPIWHCSLVEVHALPRIQNTVSTTESQVKLLSVPPVFPGLA
jgi:hypothetical protein